MSALFSQAIFKGLMTILLKGGDTEINLKSVLFCNKNFIGRKCLKRPTKESN